MASHRRSSPRCAVERWTWTWMPSETTYEHPTGQSRFRIAFSDILAAKRLDSHSFTTSAGDNIHVTLYTPPSNNAPIGSYVVCCHPQLVRSVDLGTNPLLAEAAKAAVSKHLNLRILQFHINPHNKLLFTRAYQEHITHPWTQLLQEDPGHPGSSILHSWARRRSWRSLSQPALLN